MLTKIVCSSFKIEAKPSMLECVVEVKEGGCSSMTVFARVIPWIPLLLVIGLLNFLSFFLSFFFFFFFFFVLLLLFCFFFLGIRSSMPKLESCLHMRWFSLGLCTRYVCLFFFFFFLCFLFFFLFSSVSHFEFTCFSLSQVP